jgi:glycosyltransferase involved in cell wall biosynthesis
MHDRPFRRYGAGKTGGDFEKITGARLMKIGLFLPNATFDLPGSPEVGGIETYSFTIGEALQRLGHEVVLFGGQPKAGRSHRATTLQLELSPYWETKSIPDIGTRFQRLVQRLHFGWTSRHAWERQKCDVVILAKPFDWPVAWFWKRSRPEIKVIMGFHGTDFFAGDRFFYSAVDAAFAVSPRVAALAEAHVGVRPVAIPNPVDVKVFCPSTDVPSRKAADLWNLVASGRFVGWKGFSNLIEALASLRSDPVIDFRLTLAGAGPEQEKLAAQAQSLGLTDRVIFCGRLSTDDLRDLLRSGDLYVLPSIGMEAFSIAALEAGCVGLPLLLSDQVGLGDFLTEKDFVSYPARDIGALAAALRHLYDRRQETDWTDPVARHARLSKQFSPEQVAHQLLNLIS